MARVSAECGRQLTAAQLRGGGLGQQAAALEHMRSELEGKATLSGMCTP
jgi:hypothetical protein